MSTKNNALVKTIVTILPDGTITIQKLALDETLTEQALSKAEA